MKWVCECDNKVCKTKFLSLAAEAKKIMFIYIHHVTIFSALWFAALLAAGWHDPDVEVSGGDENSERYRGDGAGDAGVGGMREAAVGDFRRADRFTRGRGTSGEPAGKNAVRLSVSAWMRGGEELRRCLFQFGMGQFGACHALGPRRGTSVGIQARYSPEASRLTGPERYQN